MVIVRNGHRVKENAEVNKLWRFLAGDTEEANLGFLLLRVFCGVAMLTHGIPKMLGGPETWKSVGGVMAAIHVPGPAVFWGFMAAFAETFGAAGVALGLLTRLSAGLMVVNMTVAALVAHAGDAFANREKALLYLLISLLYLLKGAGRISADRVIAG